MINPRKPITDAIIVAAGRNVFNDPGNLHALDNLLDAFGVPRETAANAPPSEPWVAMAIPILHEFEGYAKKRADGGVDAYPDPATGGAPWTIGWGSTTDENGNPVKPNAVWSRERAENRFTMDLAKFAEGVHKAIGGAKTSDGQFAAMVSLAYNIGLGAFTGSTLLKHHKAGRFSDAKAQFPLWNKANKKVMPGLVRRRAAEAKLYGSGR